MSTNDRDPTDLNAHAREADATELKHSATRQQEVADIKWLMAHKQGRRYVWRLLEKAGVYRTSFTGNSETFFREGQRNMGLFVLSDVMEVAAENFAKMLEENKA